jgi:hypothetical protein
MQVLCHQRGRLAVCQRRLEARPASAQAVSESCEFPRSDPARGYRSTGGATLQGKITIELKTDTPDSGSGMPDLGHDAYWLRKELPNLTVKDCQGRSKMHPCVPVENAPPWGEPPVAAVGLRRRGCAGARCTTGRARVGGRGRYKHRHRERLTVTAWRLGRRREPDELLVSRHGADGQLHYAMGVRYGPTASERVCLRGARALIVSTGSSCKTASDPEVALETADPGRYVGAPRRQSEEERE